MNKKFKILQLFLNILFIVSFIFLDQWTKYLAVLHLKGKSAYVIWKDVFELYYLENTGAAFGMFQNQKIFFIFAAVVMLTVIVYALIKVPVVKKYLPMNIFLVLLTAGAVGNMIDRLKYDYVVDFLYFKLIDFPIFNVADICVSIGTVLLAIYILFVYKEEDFKFLKLKIQKNILRF